MSASVLICPFATHTWGHLTRCFALGDALAGLELQVRFACPPEARVRVEGAGFELVELAAMANQDAMKPPRTARAAAEARRWMAGELRAAVACIRAVAPEIVVTDLQPIVNIAAALAAVPSVSLLNLELLATPLSWWLPGIERLSDELELPRWAAQRSFGDALVVADAPTATGLRDLAPDLAARIAASVREIRFVGPILSELPRRRPVAGRRRPEVVISLGGNDTADLAEIVAACGPVDADLVVITPRRSEALALAADEVRRTGRTVAIVDFLPDFARRIAEADALITHGGHGTLSQALALAVPTLVIPGSVEQEINAKRLHGIGTVASPNRSEIRANVGGQLAALLHDRARDPARARRARAIAAYDGARDAALVVHRLAQAPPLGGGW